MSTTEQHPMSPYEPVTLDKKAVAVSQLELALELWFQYADLASIHTLAAASHNVFAALGKQIGAPSLIKEHLKGVSKTEYDRFTKAEVFFKHAARDLNKTIDYDPMHAEILMLDSIEIYEAIYSDKTTTMLVFIIYFALKHPNYFDLTELFRPPVPTGFSPENFIDLNRTDFLTKFRPFIE